VTSMAERADDGTVLETPFDGVDRVDVQSVRFLPRAGVREEGWFGTRPTGGTARALAIQTMDGYEPSGTSPSVVAPGMASVDASKRLSMPVTTSPTKLVAPHVATSHAESTVRITLTQ
jgi:hypothetical protein